MDQFTTIIIVAVLLLALLLALVFAFRRSGQRVKARAGQRLGISEYHVLDNTRRLVLIRRDDVEHLLLIGGGQDVVIEAGIGSGYYAGKVERPAAPATAAPAEDAPPALETPRPAPTLRPAPAPAPAVRPAPRPSVFGERRPPALRPMEPTLPRRALDDDE